MKKKEYCSLGIMSGTSLDGLDFSLIKTDGKFNIKTLVNEYYEFNSNFKNSIKKLIKKTGKFESKSIRNSDEFRYINQKFSELVLKLIKDFRLKNGSKMKNLDVIGVHGNTIIHQPKYGISIQLGKPDFLSKSLNTIVVADFRDNDIKMKGQGAPLVPIFHQSQFSEKNKNIMVVNIGGITNFTFLIGKTKLIASDIGPGNKLIDEFCFKIFKKNFDDRGNLAKNGKLSEELLKKWKKKPFLNFPFPVSFDNAFFKLDEFLKKKNLNKFDVLRTLTYFTAFQLLNLKLRINLNIDKWIFSGGGVKNNTLMSDIKQLLSGEVVTTTLNYKMNPFFIESSAFAYIAVRTLKKLPSSFPSTTGCIKSSTSGNIYIPN